MTENDETETWRVPVIDPETGDGWDEEVEAASAQEAMQQVSDDVHIASTFVEEHMEVDV